MSAIRSPCFGRTPSAFTTSVTIRFKEKELTIGTTGIHLAIPSAKVKIGGKSNPSQPPSHTQNGARGYRAKDLNLERLCVCFLLLYKDLRRLKSFANALRRIAKDLPKSDKLGCFESNPSQLGALLAKDLRRIYLL